MKANQKELILKNLDRAIDAIRRHPQMRFDLSRYVQKNECGTLYCTAGLLTTKRHFQDQGVFYRGNAVRIWTEPGKTSSPLWMSSETNKMFGPQAFQRLFTQRWVGDFDKELMGESWEITKHLTDKQLAIARLRHQVKLVTEMTTND